jgi:hypothetical protein
MRQPLVLRNLIHLPLLNPHIPAHSLQPPLRLAQSLIGLKQLHERHVHRTHKAFPSNTNRIAKPYHYGQPGQNEKGEIGKWKGCAFFNALGKWVYLVIGDG